MKIFIFFHNNRFEISSNVMRMKFVIYVHQNNITFICNVKIMICLQKNDYELIYKVISMLFIWDMLQDN
jgi:hypothetical protein